MTRGPPAGQGHKAESPGAGESSPAQLPLLKGLTARRGQEASTRGRGRKGTWPVSVPGRGSSQAGGPSPSYGRAVLKDVMRGEQPPGSCGLPWLSRHRAVLFILFAVQPSRLT